MKEYTVKTLSKVAEVGLTRLDSGLCTLDEKNEDPEGILIRSTKLDRSNLNDSLLAISRAGAGVNNIPVKECTEKGSPPNALRDQKAVPSRSEATELILRRPE